MHELPAIILKTLPDDSSYILPKRYSRSEQFLIPVPAELTPNVMSCGLVYESVFGEDGYASRSTVVCEYDFYLVFQRGSGIRNHNIQQHSMRFSTVLALESLDMKQYVLAKHQE